MPMITFSHKKLKYSLTALFILLFTVVSFSFGTSYGRKIIFAEQSPVGENRQAEKSAAEKSVFASVFSIFYRTSEDDLSPSAIFTVNDNGDSPDLTPGNGVCSDAAGKCTLRAAIQEANALAGADAINFSFIEPADTIQLDANISPNGLSITEAVAINGPGARLLTIIGNNSNTTADIFSVAATATGTTKISGITIQKSGRYGINNAGRLELSDVTIKESKNAGINNIARLSLNRALIHNNANGGIRLANSSIAVNISNTTVSGNSSADNGGGINSASADVTFNNVTISHNYAIVNGGGLYYSGQANGINIRNTIIASNNASTGTDIFANNGVNFVSRGNNLIGKNGVSNGFVNGTNGDKVGTLVAGIDPLLGNLQNNGGQTDTRALLPNSPAKDAGNMCVSNLTCTQNNPAVALNTDQRGTDMPRIFETTVDMGAFETFYPQASISSLLPSNWGAGRGAFELIVNGSGFVAGSQVKWNGQNRTTTFLSNNQLKANILASDVAVAGQYPVVVVNPQPNPGQSDAVNFTVATCDYSLNPSSLTNFSPQGGSGSTTLTTTNGCTWTAQSNVPWITINNGSASGTGTANVIFTVQPNTGEARTGTLTIGGKTLTLTQQKNCTFSLSENSANFTNAAGNGTVFLQASDQTCTWATTSSVSWISINSGSESGAGTKIISYSVQANTGAQRTGTLTIAGQTYTVTQANGCTYGLNPTSTTIAAAGGPGSFSVTAGTGCTWNATTSIPWISINSGASGSGNGTVSFTIQANTGAARSGTISVGAQTFTVNQNAPCTYTLSSTGTAQPVPGAGGNGSFGITTQSGCEWSATSNVSWITFPDGSTGTGNGTVNFSVAPNTATTSRTGTISVGGKNYTVNQAPGCTFSLNPTALTVSSGSGNATVALTTQNGCAWTAQSSVPWISISANSASGTGSATIAFTYQANTGPERSGTITIGGQTFAVTQTSGCTFSLSANSADVPNTAGSPTVNLTTNNTACTWTATSNAPWITINAGSTSGSGSKTISYSVQANTGPARTGTITIGGQTFTVNQASGCTYSLLPTSANILSGGGNGSVNLTTSNTACAWQAVSNVPWVTITSSGSGTGSQTVTFSVQPNPGAAREGTLTIGGQTFTVKQAVGCSFTLNPTSADFPSAGNANATVTVTASDPGCAWTAATSDSWITVNAGSTSGTGTKVISYAVQANTGPARQGKITIGGQTLIVNQASGCTFTLTPNQTSFTADGGAGSFTVTPNNQACTWNATPSASWIKINSGSSGTGNGTVNFTVDPNITPQRTGNISINGVIFNITQSNGCRISLSPSNASVPNVAGSDKFSLNTGEGCQWTITTNASWLNVTNGTSGTGSKEVNFSYSANNGLQRVGIITISGQNFTGGQFTVTQANGCRFSLTPPSPLNVPIAGGEQTVTVTASDQGCTWTASVTTANASWITITSGTSGTGSGVVIFNVAANTGPARSATLTIAGNTYTVNQANGCTYSLTPTETSIDVDSSETRDFTVKVSNNLCTWAATSNASWITITSGNSGTGEGKVTIAIQASPDQAEREGTVTAANLTFTVRQVSLTVRNRQDSGLGSLRQAVLNANNSRSDSVIKFAPGLTGIIELTSGEIKITNSATSGKLEIRGPGADKIMISGGAASRIFFIDEATVTISGLTLSGGNGVGEKSNGNDKLGGAIYVNQGATTFSGLNVTGNSIMAPPGEGTQNSGGGIYYWFGGNHRIENSTISNNESVVGGGITNIALFEMHGLTIHNSTISGNKATASSAGIHVLGMTNLRNVTIVNNTVTDANGKGAGVGVYSGYMYFGNTIIAENNGPEITLSQDNGVALSLGNNLIGDTPGDSTNTGRQINYPNTDILDTKPRVSLLYNFGGTTPTVALMTDSPAINKGNNDLAPSSTDQRGLGRFINNITDIGAFEHSITLNPAGPTLPGGSVGTNYSGQQISAIRVPAQEQLKFALIGGELPPGLSITDIGYISGIPELTGTYRFFVRAIGADGMAGANWYTINIGCSVSLSPISQDFSAAGGNNTINVTAADGCIWNATSQASWIKITPPSGANGNGQVKYTVDPNSGAQRGGRIFIGDKTFTVNQSGTSCTYDLAPSSANISASAGTGAFQVNTQGGCTWSATSNVSWITVPSNGASGSGTGTVSYSVAANTGSGRTGKITAGGKDFTINQAAQPAARRTAFDFDGDGKADAAVFRPSNNTWYVLKSTSGFIGTAFGNSTDKLAPADFDGDGRTDISVFRDTDGWWYRYNSSNDAFEYSKWGQAGDIQVPADYDGDSKADLAVFRGGNWYISQSSNGEFRAVQFGLATDIPVPADFDGDGKTDIAVFREGHWYWLKSTDGNFSGLHFGAAGDKPVVGDYDGDGKADQAVFRGGFWYMNGSTSGFKGEQFGVASDLPTPADYDGDGKTDVAVYRDGAWYILNSSDGQFRGFGWGLATDKPIQRAYLP